MDGGRTSALRSIIDAIPALVWWARADGAMEFVNRRWLDYTGLSEEQALSWGWTDVIHPDERAALERHWRLLLSAGKPGEIQTRMRRADGEHRWFLIRVSPLRDDTGTLVQWYGTSTDVDDIRRSHEILRASEQGFRLVIDGIPGLIYTMTARGEVDLVNDPTLRYFGRSLEELRNWAMTDAVHPDDRPRVAAEWGRAVASGGDYDVEQRLRGANGAYRWFHGKAHAVRDVEGRVAGWYGLLTDIDDRKRAERRLRRATRARHDAAITERIRIARDMHDGLLQDITGIALRVAGLLPHIRSSPDVAEKRMELLLESIQKTNRAARQAVVGMRRDVDSADLVTAVQGKAQRLTTQARLALSLRVSGPVRLVPAAVRDAAVALVHEAVTNVVKHAGASGVRISIAFSRNRLCLALRDDGLGLTLPADPDIEVKHFGFAGMRERAASIGAALRVASVPGRGTSIRMEVPLTE